MHGTLGDDLDDRDALVRLVREELTTLRGMAGTLTIQKFGQFDALRRVCGGGDLLDAFLMFEREMTPYRTSAGRNEAAAAITITAPAETVLDRLEYAVGALPQDGKLRDQRTARRWSDAGLLTIADELVYMADVQGRLGQEILNVEVTGDGAHGLMFAIDQMSSITLPVRAPLVRIWHYPRGDEPEEHALNVDLERVENTTVRSDEHVMSRHHLHVALPDGHDQDAREGRILTVSIEGRDAPMRTVTLKESTHLGTLYEVETTVYRTIVTIDVIRSANPTRPLRPSLLAGHHP